MTSSNCLSARVRQPKKIFTKFSSSQFFLKNSEKFRQFLLDVLRTDLTAVREIFAKPKNRSDRRLYISRGTGTQKIMNEDALKPILEGSGFEIYNPSADARPPTDFGEAGIIIGSHSAGLTDIVFCPSRGKSLN